MHELIDGKKPNQKDQFFISFPDNLLTLRAKTSVARQLVKVLSSSLVECCVVFKTKP